MEEYAHEGYVVRPVPEALKGGKWSPKAMIILQRGDTVTFTKIYSSKDVTCDTEEEARMYGLALAKAWIDGRNSKS